MEGNGVAIEQVIPPGTYADRPAPFTAPVRCDRGFLDEVETVWLPPQEYRKHPGEALPTPVDERGLVKIPELLEIVKATVEPEFQWPRGKGSESTHHFYWPASAYPGRQAKSPHNPAGFRELSIHKGKLPRVFENWLHIVTLPPEVPSEEVMQYRMQAWQVASNLFKSARRVVQWERRAKRRADYILENPHIIADRAEGDVIGQQYIAEIIDKHFEGVERHMMLLERVPPEFRLVKPCESPQELAKSLGQIIVPRSLRLAQTVNDPALEMWAA